MIRARDGEDGRLIVEEGELVETSQVTLAAYGSAGSRWLPPNEKGRAR